MCGSGEVSAWKVEHQPESDDDLYVMVVGARLFSLRQ